MTTKINISGINELDFPTGIISATTNAGITTINLPNFADGEIPSGAVNGTNVTFTLAHNPNPALSLQLFVGGLRQLAGAGNDYTLSGNTITMAVAPSTGANIVASYRY